MAWQTLQFRLTSSCPMLMHNGQTADPLNKWSKLIKKISGKRAKTDEDHERISYLEFMAGLYMSEDGPILPSYLIDAVIIKGANLSKEGTLAKSGMFAPTYAVLEYEGPRVAEELWEHGGFTDRQPARVSGARIIRTRPIFRQWSTIVTVNVEPEIINPSLISDWLITAGKRIGVGDWRPQHGRFTVERV